MVIPWVGYSLADRIKQEEPLGSAKYVEFLTQADSKSVPGIRARVLDRPYVVRLRLDEAMHLLTLLAYMAKCCPIKMVLHCGWWFRGSMVSRVWLIGTAALDWLGANPVEALERSTGDWALCMLCVVLAVTPLRTIAGLPEFAKFRRVAGLFVHFCTVLHLFVYSWFDMGFTAIVLLPPLALTPFSRAIRALHACRWQLSLCLPYMIAVLAIVHFFWTHAGMHNFAEVSVYAVILVSRMVWRVVQFAHKRD